MFSRILSLLSNRPSEPEPLPGLDAQLALGALLVRVAKADLIYLFQEIELIDRMLADRFNLNPVEALKMRATCETLEKAIPETPEFADLIRTSVSKDERRGMVRALWSVALADGKRVDSEDKVMGVVSRHFGFSKAEAEALRDEATGAAGS